MPDLDTAFVSLRTHVDVTVRTPETRQIVAAGRRRRAVRVAAAGVAVVVAAGGVAFAFADDGPDRTTRIAVPIEVPIEVPPAVPAGFLRYEAEATARPDTLEYRADEPGSWPPEQCVGGGAESGPAPAAERWLVFADRARPVRIERVDVFADAAAARNGFAALRAALQACPDQSTEAGLTTTRTVEPLALGDEAFLIKEVTPGGAPPTTWTAYVRRGAAVAEYGGADQTRVRSDATAMTGALCRYAGGC
jgi:hypothetical protein